MRPDLIHCPQASPPFHPQPKLDPLIRLGGGGTHLTIIIVEKCIYSRDKRNDIINNTITIKYLEAKLYCAYYFTGHSSFFSVH